MNMTTSFSSDHSWSRRCSTETIFSIQGKETDFVRDTSDTEIDSSEAEREYEPATESEDDGPVDGDSSGQSDNEIITTKVIEVSVGDDGELQFADSEQTDSDGTDSEVDLYDYWLCAQCRADNNNPLYRYCEKCYKVRKNFFPPRPKRKTRRNNRLDSEPLSQESVISAKIVPESDSIPISETLPDSQPLSIPDIDTNDSERFTRTLSQDSGVGSAFNSQESCPEQVQNDIFNTNVILGRRKRRAGSVHRDSKRIRTDHSGSDSEISEKSDADVQPIVKTISDPGLTIENKMLPDKIFKEKLEVKDDMCIVCFAEPKSGVFVHGRIAHICCCYKCAMKVWAKAKRCPICNCKVSNVLKAVM